MIRAHLPSGEQERVRFVPVRDYYEDSRWAEAVRHAVLENAKPVARVKLIGHFKDASSYYLNHFPQWELVAVEREHPIDATSIRRVLFEAENIETALDTLVDELPMAVRHYLKSWAALPYWMPLVEEHRQVAAYRAAWSRAPYPPVFSTVDAVVRAAGHVLLVQRGGFPGRGQWALPGGFVDQRERLLQAAIRELKEETQLDVPRKSIEEALVAVRVFDHPDRSQRGRTITHAHFFDLKVDRLPEISASDDAANAQWIPEPRIAELEEQFYEDHFHILDTFLHLPQNP